MEIVIDINDEIYKEILNGKDGWSNYVHGLIRTGIPLPKGHGDLIDVNRKINVPVYDEQYEEWGEKTLTVREALNRWSDEGVTIKDVVILADKEQEDTYKYLLHGAESLVKDHPDLVRDIWNCSSCEHTEDECKDCYPELGYKNNKLKRDTEAVEEFVKSDTFKELMESLDEQDRAAKEDVEQFLRDIKAKEQKE